MKDQFLFSSPDYTAPTYLNTYSNYIVEGNNLGTFGGGGGCGVIGGGGMYLAVSASYFTSTPQPGQGSGGGGGYCTSGSFTNPNPGTNGGGGGGGGSNVIAMTGSTNQNAIYQSPGASGGQGVLILWFQNNI